MNNLRVTFPLPTVAADQRALTYSSVEMRTDDAFEFLEVARVPANAPGTPNNTTVLPQLSDGAYQIRVRCSDGVEFGDYSDVAKITLSTAPVFRKPGTPGTPTLSVEP